MIRKAGPGDIASVSELAALLWPNNSAEDLSLEFEDLLANPECAVFLAFPEDKATGDKAIGFAQVQLRHDYVEGTDSSPVGYLEGIFVREGYRGQGTAAALLRECEKWAADIGCSEFASDCELSNDGSLAFHLNFGFTEANRIICFVNRIQGAWDRE